MLYYYIKIAFKSLWHNKKYSAINILGFAFSLSVSLAIVFFVFHEKSYDRYQSNSKNIYRLIDTKENSSSIDYRAADILKQQFTGIEKVCLYSQSGEDMPVTYNKKGFYIKGIASVDNTFFQIFDFEFVKGNKKIGLENLNSAILTESVAGHIFGDDDPIGKDLTIMGNYNLIVSGVIRDFPDNCSFDPGIIVNAENDDFKMERSIGNSEDSSTYRWPFRIYVELKDGNSPDLLINTINKNIDFLKPYVAEAGLLPLRDIYLNDKTWGSRTKKGNPGLLRLLIAIAIVILLMAVVNYISLALARQHKRGKEIGIRKTVGANRTDLINQFLFESILIMTVAFGLALLIFELNYPLIKNLFGVSVDLRSFLGFPEILLIPGFLLFLGFITGIYPALAFSSFNPVNIFGKGFVLRGPKKKSRNFLTIFQFAVSATLIFCSLVIRKQIEYTKHKDLGFNKEQLLKIDLPPSWNPAVASMSNGFINELRNYPNITKMTASLGVPGQIFIHMGSGMEGKNQSLAIIYADTSFLNTFDIELIDGRAFLSGDEGKSCIINRAAYNFFEWEDLDKKRYENGGGFDVIGVAEDFHLGSLHNQIEPTVIIFERNNVQQLSLKIRPDKIGETMDFLNKTWQKNLSEFPMSYTFYDDWFNSMYEKDERFGKIISYFSLLGIIISGIGVFGLSIFNAEQRTKEIGIRKVNGATISNIMALLTKEYTLWVSIAFVIAAPIGFFLMDRWLQAFAYQTEISFWVYALSGISILLVAWGTASWQSIKAARRNPVDVLKYE